MEEKHNSPATGTGSPPAGSAEPQSSRRRGGVLKRKASSLSNSNTSTPPASSSLKRQAREKPSPVMFPPIHNGPCTRARQQPNYADSTTFWDAVVVNGDGEGSALPMPVAAKVEEEVNARKEAWEALEAKIEAEYDTVKSRDASAHVVPISSGWFSWTKVHPLEEKALPNFFNGKSENRTPEIYMEIRNAIMNRFHANPNKQIEVKDLTEISVGESDAKQEVMEFLDYWGLINYHPFPEADTTSSAVDADEVAKVNSLIKKLYEFETEHLCSVAAFKPSVTTPTVPSRLPESMVTEESMEPEGPSVEYHCNSCSADCSRKRYHCQKQADFDLCTECFNGRKFDSDMSPSDFILMEPADAAGASSGKWTDQETLLLLEALELFSENWNEIAEHVATKTKAQCILHFVQMPIEDTFLDCDDEDNTSHKETDGRKEIDADQKKEIDAVLEENADEKEVDATLKKENEAAAATKIDAPSIDAPVMKETKDPKALLNNDSSPPNDDPSNNDQPNSSPMEISESMEPEKLKDTQESGANVAVKALREAFEAVGSLPSPEEKFSFADAGNPVMALAAFLRRLVEPNIATASARTSLKSVSDGGTGLQLSARHSFIIQHPNDEKNKSDDNADSVVKQKEDKSSMIDSNGTSNDCNEKEDTNSTKEEKESLVSLEKDKDSATEEVAPCNSFKKDKSSATETDLVTTDEIKTSPPKESSSMKLQKEQEPTTAGEISEQKCQIEDPLSSKMESEDFPDPPEASKGDTEAKDCKNENKSTLETKDDPSIHSLKRAAVTAISAAAVKAKFLADQEEDQIRQLATSLIEKQLHKLETKLAFFTDMDNVVGRVREQLERSKQRLYHERAQIIAAKLGMSSASSTRPMPPSLQNRLPMTFPRPQNPMSMTPQRPPFSRPMVPPMPPGLNPTAGNSSVGMQ